MANGDFPRPPINFLSFHVPSSRRGKNTQNTSCLPVEKGSSELPVEFIIKKCYDVEEKDIFSFLPAKETT